MSKFAEIDQLENQFLLRCPQGMANEINKYLDMKVDAHPLLSIQSRPYKDGDAQRIILDIELNGVTRRASVLQLPTISQTFKTIDKVNYFKSNDISQMIYVHEEGESEVSIELARKTTQIKRSVSQPKRFVKYKAHSGITPPTQYIKQRYFRKKPQIPLDKLQQVESQLQKIKQEIVGLPRAGEENEDSKKAKRKYNRKFL